MEIDNVGGPQSVNPISESSEVQLEALFPSHLTSPITAAQFEKNIARFEASYPVHGKPHATAQCLQEGLDLSAESSLPLTQGSRALGSALSRFKDEEDS